MELRTTELRRQILGQLELTTPELRPARVEDDGDESYGDCEFLDKRSSYSLSAYWRTRSPVPAGSAASPSSDNVNDEPDVTVALPMQEHHPAGQLEKIDWTMMVIGFCMESAIDIALQSVQSRNHDDGSSSAFHFLSLLILFTFAALFVAKFISRSKFPMAAKVVEGFGLLLAALAFCYAVSIPFPYALKCTTWATFVICLLVILICKYRL
ncbi:hypothetical protein TorRG33x02_198240 [Trema orientale]|uniref:Transmembrane protein n=1 Tax=Trema orientale TaxID=63057 RepID=A0A2P5EFR9_TREOI|nr:hypothetical protein TorRG33x02_198240 [Trema orientale]